VFSRRISWRELGKICLRLLTFFIPIIAALPLSPVSLRAQSDSATPTRASFTPIFPAPVLPPPRVPLPPTSPPRSPGAPPKSPPHSFGFTELSRASGRIFSGTVTAISNHAPTDQGLETVSITFHVDHAIRGVVTGEDLTITQWMGAWSTGQRYRVGEHLLLFLYPPSKLGLTSCVGGNLGRFTFDSLGLVLLSQQHRSAFRTDPIFRGKPHASFNDFALAVELSSSQAEARE
jgi:hypothetical protein